MIKNSPYGQCNRHVYEDLISIEQIRKIIQTTGLQCNSEDRLYAEIGIDIFVLKSYWTSQITQLSKPLKSKIKIVNDEKALIEKTLDKQINCITEILDILENSNDYLTYEGQTKKKDIEITQKTLTKLLQSKSSFKKECLNSFNDQISRLNEEKYKNISPLTVLMGDLIPKIYESNFHCKWGFSRPPSGGEPYGPSLRFCLSILKLLEINKSAEAIISARKKCNGEQ